MTDLVALVRAYFRAYETGDRRLIEDTMAADFTFTSPFDDAIGREAYFRRCWPNNTNHRRFDIEAIARDGG